MGTLLGLHVGETSVSGNWVVMDPYGFQTDSELVSWMASDAIQRGRPGRLS